MNRIYQIVNGSITLYVTQDYSGLNFSLKGFTMERDPDHFYTNLSPASLENIGLDLKGRSVIEISDFVAAYYRSKADAEQKVTISNRLAGSEKIDGTEPFASFWKDALSQGGRTIRPEDIGSESYRGIAEGIVDCTIGRSRCRYDFVIGQHIGAYSIYEQAPEKKLNISIRELLYQGKELLLLAEELERQGIAPPAYSEIRRINQFLEAKKTARLVLNSNFTYELKARKNIGFLRADDLLDITCDDGHVAIIPAAYRKNFTPHLSDDIPLHEFKCLEHGRQRYFLRIGALKTLDMPKSDSQQEEVSK